MKIVHLTDLHVQPRPALRELHGKRLLGTANLYILGRRAKFTLDVAWYLDETTTSIVNTSDGHNLLADSEDGQLALTAQMQFLF